MKNLKNFLGYLHFNDVIEEIKDSSNENEESKDSHHGDHRPVPAVQSGLFIRRVAVQRVATNGRAVLGTVGEQLGGQVEEVLEAELEVWGGAAAGDPPQPPFSLHLSPALQPADCGALRAGGGQALPGRDTLPAHHPLQVSLLVPASECQV